MYFSSPAQNVPVNVPATGAVSPPRATVTDAAYLLVIHGSRDPRPLTAAQQLADQVAQQLSASVSPLPLVEVACLELAALPLHQQIMAFGDRALQAGYTTLVIVPLFLLPGVHVCEDIPEEVAIAQTMLSQGITVQLHPYLGQAIGMGDMVARQLQPIAQGTQDTPTTPILLAHGSRRPGGNQPIEAIASQMTAIPAYWAVSPTLDEQIHQLAQQGIRHITVLPYFLFPGAITDGIAGKIGEMGDRYPHLTLALGQPLGHYPEMVSLLISHLTRSTNRENSME